MGGSWVGEGCKQAEGVRVCVQVALHELSKCLPEGQRPMPAHLVEVADNNTSALPNTGMDAGHTLSHPSSDPVSCPHTSCTGPSRFQTAQSLCLGLDGFEA